MKRFMGDLLEDIIEDLPIWLSIVALFLIPVIGIWATTGDRKETQLDRIEQKIKEADMKYSVLLLEIRGVSLQIDKLREVPEWRPNLQPLPNLTLPNIVMTNIPWTLDGTNYFDTITVTNHWQSVIVTNYLVP